MTARGVMISVSRLGALAALVLALGYLGFDHLTRPQPLDDSPRVFAAETPLDRVPEAARDGAAALGLHGPVAIEGPDGSRLSSETGAVLDPLTGNIDLLGTSKLSTTR